ncbi:MAG: glycosyltransferase family 4 protein, partial [Actinomycetia bacterium]|nr:glycosyltransferase family 4 protein [Actinomycetes bacterium]
MSPHRKATKPLRILYGTTVGGSAYHLLHGQMSWLSQQGHEVRLATTPDALAHQAVEREGVPLIPIQMEREISLRHDLKALFRWLKTIRDYRPDVINVGTPKASLLGGLAAYVLRVPIRVYVVRGLRAEGAKGRKRALLLGMEWLTMRLANRIVFVSDSLADESARHRLTPARHTYILASGSSNGVDAKGIAQFISSVDATQLRASLGIHKDEVVVGFIGRLTSDKGVEDLVEAFRSPALNAKARLLLIGQVEDPSIASRLEEITARVIPIGFVRDIRPYLPAIDILCLPTKREGFPNVVLEAAAAGIPAITTRATGARDSVVDGETGTLVDAGDTRALVGGINRLIDQPHVRQQMGRNARLRVERDFAPQRIWNALNALYLQTETEALRT